MVNVSTSSESLSSDTGNNKDIKDRYEYRKIMQSLKNNISKISNSSQPYRRIDKLSNRQLASKRTFKRS